MCSKCPSSASLQASDIVIRSRLHANLIISVIIALDASLTLFFRFKISVHSNNPKLKKKTSGDRSGDRASHRNDPLLPIN